jgi:transcription antitermination factor NusG
MLKRRMTMETPAANSPARLPEADAQDWVEPQWYALFVRSNQERRVAGGLSARGLQHFLPCYSEIHQWKDRRVNLELPLFPGYVFVRLPLVERVRALTVPNVVTLVGKKSSPSAVPDEEIEAIRNAARDGRARPHALLVEGEWVTIVAGPFIGISGILKRGGNGTRVVITVDSIARAFAVEVNASCVEAMKPVRIARERTLAQAGLTTRPRLCSA